MQNFSKNIALWLIIGLLLIALFNLFQGTSKDQTGYSISFSDFMAAVETGNVSEVDIRGNNVEGSFEDGLLVVQLTKVVPEHHTRKDFL